MISRMKSVVLLAVLAALTSGCVMGPVGPSLPVGQFVVIVKGEPGPVDVIRRVVEEQIRIKKILGCKREVPPSETEVTKPGMASFGDQLVYRCVFDQSSESGSAFAIFTTAYQEAIKTSLVEMKFTTSSGCQAKTCYGGPLQLWRVPCLTLC
jgi:hypothetical protein